MKINDNNNNFGDIYKIMAKNFKKIELFNLFQTQNHCN